MFSHEEIHRNVRLSWYGMTHPVFRRFDISEYEGESRLWVSPEVLGEVLTSMEI